MFASLVLLLALLASMGSFFARSSIPDVRWGQRSSIVIVTNHNDQDDVSANIFVLCDPKAAGTPNEEQMVERLYTKLVSLDANGNVIPQLARSYEVSSDGLTWTFHLRSNVKCSDGSLSDVRRSDGNPLTAVDVARSIDQALDPANPSAASALGVIQDADKRMSGDMATLIDDSLTTPDQHTLSIKLERPDPDFLVELASS